MTLIDANRYFPDWESDDNPRYDQWVPYSREDLTCAKCTSTNTDRVKCKADRKAKKRDVLLCRDCGHKTDRWDRQQEGAADAD